MNKIIVSCIAAVLSLIVIVALCLPQTIRNVLFEKRHHCDACEDLKTIGQWLYIYQQDYGRYPSMQLYTNGGAADLYPLYQRVIDKKQFLAALGRSKANMMPFTRNPAPDEFDSNHIVYIYNSLIIPGASGNPPIIAERGVNDGVLSPSDDPVFTKGAHVLLENGEVRWLPTMSDGTLSIGDIDRKALSELK